MNNTPENIAPNLGLGRVVWALTSKGNTELNQLSMQSSVMSIQRLIGIAWTCTRITPPGDLLDYQAIPWSFLFFNILYLSTTKKNLLRYINQNMDSPLTLVEFCDLIYAAPQLQILISLGYHNQVCPPHL